ncbi:MAG: DnaJ domain-containing protein [Myxococcota bacterium]
MLEEEFGKVLCLAPDCDPTALEIDPSEGFLLSRIDGRTPWRVLREMGAMSPEEVDLCLEGWIARGILRVDDEASDRDAARREQSRQRAAASRRARAEREAEAPLPTELDESLLDDELEIDLAIQRRILEFELTLRAPYHEILGVPADADTRKIKKAYFKLSKEFHPDRFFRKQVGGYGERLDRIFKKVTEAYELLSDPATRAEVEKSMRGVTPPPVAAQGAESGEPAPPPRPLTKLERLRQRMPRLPESVLADRRRKAREFFDAARISENRGSFVEAAQGVRLAIAFDPFNEEYKREFGEIQAKAAEQRAERLLEETEGIDASQMKQALRMLEDVLLYRPHDPKVNDRAAGVSLELGQVEKARECAQRSVEHSPDVVDYRKTLVKVHLAAGEKGYAAHELEKAQKLDPADPWIRRMLASLKSRPVKTDGGMK